MTDTIDDVASLRELFGKPGELAVACMKPKMDEYHRAFIEKSPFLCLASSTPDGQPFISPKGDAPGFVEVADESTLLIPDRRGNNKVESFSNIIENPKVSLIFFVPGLPETLRVLGEARVTTDQELRGRFEAGGVVPRLATCITVTTVYFHCGKAVVRSKLWGEENKLERGDFPSFGAIIKQQAKLEISQDESEALIDDMYTNGLY